MTKKMNWVDIDKRVRARKVVWSNEERETLDSALRKLPDLAERLDIVELPQPAIGGATPPAGRADAPN